MGVSDFVGDKDDISYQMCFIIAKWQSLWVSDAIQQIFFLLNNVESISATSSNDVHITIDIFEYPFTRSHLFFMHTIWCASFSMTTHCLDVMNVRSLGIIYWRIALKKTMAPQLFKKKFMSWVLPKPKCQLIYQIPSKCVVLIHPNPKSIPSLAISFTRFFYILCPFSQWMKKKTVRCNVSPCIETNHSHPPNRIA